MKIERYEDRSQPFPSPNFKTKSKIYFVSDSKDSASSTLIKTSGKEGELLLFSLISRKNELLIVLSFKSSDRYVDLSDKR